MWLKRLIKYLERHDSVKGQILGYCYVISWFGCLKKNYEQTYGRKAQQDHQNDKDGPVGPTTTRISIDPCPREQPTLDLEWRDFPERSKKSRVLRVLTTVWMMYSVVRFCLINQISLILHQFVELEMPLHCYLAGRFILAENVAQITGTSFSAMHLAWRSYLALKQAFELSLVSFMLLSEHDREAIYSKLGPSKSFEVSLIGNVNDYFSPRERFILDTMCYRIIHQAKIVFKLRSNRTREAHRELCRTIAMLTIMMGAVMVVVGIILYITQSIMILLDSRYMAVYQNCDPELERLRDEGKLGDWSVTIRLHHLLTAPIDTAENLIIWIECGLITVVPPGICYLLSHDLILSWNGIKRKINQFEVLAENKQWKERRATRQSLILPLRSTSVNAKRVRLAPSYAQIYELAAEMSDFFNHISKIDNIISVVLDALMLACLGLCAVYTYYLRVQSIDRLPASLAMVLVYLAVAITGTCRNCMMVHRSCIRSYSKLCSLMAFDHMEHGHIYGRLVEFFARRRTCFTILNHYPFLPTTFLALIGWTFTCFCIITEVLRSNQLQAWHKG